MDFVYRFFQKIFNTTLSKPIVEPPENVTYLERTPLIIASSNGYYDVVEYLIKYCNVDVNQTGTITIDETQLTGVTPIWCAAAFGHLKIVELLLNCGADMNSVSPCHSGPLYVACFQNDSSLVTQLIQNGADVNATNKYGSTCLMLACRRGDENTVRLLLEAGADINKKTLKGITAIYCCAAYDNLLLLKLLIEKGALVNVEYSVGVTPLMIAAIYGYHRIVEYLLNYSECFTREHRIDALEVLGASLINKHSDFSNAKTLWFQAFEERNQEPILPKKINPIRKQVYGNILEIANEGELRQMQFDFENLKMQALILYERVFNQNFEFLYDVILIRARSDRGRSVALLQHCLELLIQSHTVGTTSMEICLLRLSRLIMLRHKSIFKRVQLSANDIFLVIRKSIEGVQLHYNDYLNLKDAQSINKIAALHHLNVVILNTFNFVFWFNKLITDSNKNDEIVRNFYDEIRKLTRMNIRFKFNRNILHQFLVKRGFQYSSFPSVEVVNILLQCGMNPNDEDDRGNRALHYANEYDCCLKTVEVLLRFGAHYDAANYNGDTYRSYWTNLGWDAFWVNIDPIRVPFIKANKFVTLQCLAAITIKKFKIPFESQVPSHLKDFINCHSNRY